ncbi:EF-hand domain-containing protein [Akkermansiaceae bacterium]|nr:EF-hand domain-containing protein [Akkermansiaceae bacterium]
MKTNTLIVIAASIGLIGTAAAEEGKQRPERKLPPEMLKKFDKDGDGKLSEEERAAARAALANRPDRKLPPEMLAKFDKDGDGKLNEEERKAAREAMKARMLERFDKDGDGQLNEEERAEMRKAMGGHRPGGDGRQQHTRDGRGKPAPEGDGEAPGVTE